MKFFAHTAADLRSYSMRMMLQMHYDHSTTHHTITEHNRDPTEARRVYFHSSDGGNCDSQRKQKLMCESGQASPLTLKRPHWWFCTCQS